MKEREYPRRRNFTEMVSGSRPGFAPLKGDTRDQRCLRIQRFAVVSQLQFKNNSITGLMLVTLKYVESLSIQLMNIAPVRQSLPIPRLCDYKSLLSSKLFLIFL